MEDSTHRPGPDIARRISVTRGGRIDGRGDAPRDLVYSRFNLDPGILAAWRYLRWGIAVSVAVLAVELLYHFGPDVKQRLRDSLAGAFVAVMPWIGLSYILGIYFRYFESLEYANSRLTMDMYAQSILDEQHSSDVIGAVLAVLEASVPKRPHDNLYVVVGA
jgi:Virulence factor BrkB